MEHEVLKQDILNKIKNDPMLYGKVAAELEISPASLPRLIYDKDKRLTQFGVLRILCEHLGIDNMDNILEIIFQSGDNDTTKDSKMQEA